MGPPPKRGLMLATKQPGPQTRPVLAGEVVSFFLMLRQVESRAFVFFTQAKPNHLIHNKQNDQGANNRETPGNGYANRLVQHLTPVSFKQAERFSRAENRID